MEQPDGGAINITQGNSQEDLFVKLPPLPSIADILLGTTPAHRWRCTRGHEYEAAYPEAVTFHHIGEDVKMCIRCIGDWIAGHPAVGTVSRVEGGA